MRKFITLITAMAISIASLAQTNLQIQYDLGTDRQCVTTTVEGFYSDNWGNTFFFIDHDFPTSTDLGANKAQSGTYCEIARCLNFWQNTKLGGLSAQVEYNGGVYSAYNINHAFLFGVDYFLHTKDFNNTFNVKVLYKYIMYTDPDTRSNIPLQFTFVWTCRDLFGAKGLTFSGFADAWWEEHMLYSGHGGPITPEASSFVFLSEPQLWYNVGQWFGCNNLNIGGEVELSYDFGSTKGFWARPALGVKWVF